MNKTPKLYEINTRVWIKKFSNVKNLSEVPIEYFQNLAKKGFDYIWIMGVWKTPVENIEYALIPDLTKNYDKCFPAWKKEDVSGSPFAIDSYQLNPELGNFDNLLHLKNKLNKIGLKLILDFIPNHFAVDSSIVKKYPQYFLNGDEQLIKKDNSTYFRSKFDKNIILAHGRDPFFPAWSDTVQLNYFSEETRTFMTEQLVQIAKYCDGVRCDMAMLSLNNIFQNTWPHIISKFKLKKPEYEFWNEAIKTVKKENSDFKFIAEVYWDLEQVLQKLGFDFTYCKFYLDMFLNKDVIGIKSNLNKGEDFNNKSVVFIENHDEERSAKVFSSRIHLVIISFLTMPGMKIIYDGQIEGEKIKFPVQLGKTPNVKISKGIKEFYDKMLEIVNDEVYKNGSFQLLTPLKFEDKNDFHENILAWYWKTNKKLMITIVNYSSENSKCKIKLVNEKLFNNIEIKCKLTKTSASIDSKKITEEGYPIELSKYEGKILEINR